MLLLWTEKPGRSDRRTDWQTEIGEQRVMLETVLSSSPSFLPAAEASLPEIEMRVSRENRFDAAYPLPERGLWSVAALVDGLELQPGLGELRHASVV